jgi:hypothetical protein
MLSERGGHIVDGLDFRGMATIRRDAAQQFYEELLGTHMANRPDGPQPS